MKKNSTKLAMAFLIVLSMNSCATVFGGRVGECQRTQPAPGQPILFWPGAIVDFATGAIYRPCDVK